MAVCLKRIGSAVAASQRLQQIIVETLHANTQAVDSAIQVSGELFAAEVAGVCFERYLRVRFHVEGGVDGLHRMANVPGWQVRRGAAAEEYGVNFRAAEQCAPKGDFRVERRNVIGHQRLNSGIGIEVAIRALRLTERYVDIQGD